jgi:hypothetical protein
MIKAPVFAAVFAAFVLSGCQPCSKCQLNDPSWTDVKEAYPDDNSLASYSDSWTEVYPDNVLVEDSDIEQKEMPRHDSYISEPYYEERVDSRYWTEKYPSFESVEIDGALIEQATSSTYGRPAYSVRRVSTVSYPSNEWQTRFLGNRSTMMYTYPQPNLQQQSTVPPPVQFGMPFDFRRTFR